MGAVRDGLQPVAAEHQRRSPGAADATTLGLTVTAIELIAFQFRSSSRFREIFDLDVGRDAALDEGITGTEVDALMEEMTLRSAVGRFLAVGTMYVVVAEKASPASS